MQSTATLGPAVSVLPNKLQINQIKLPLNRAAGKDGSFAEHIFYADSSVCNHLSSLFNVCLMHGKIPQECMQTVIVPICKNKNGNISDAGNKRPVSLATIISIVVPV